MNEKKNTAILQGLCVALPVMALAAAHWFPWKKVRGRELHRLETYIIGTGAIVGTAGAAIALSDGDKNDHVGMLALAAASAGSITLAAHAVDHLTNATGKIANLEAQVKALKDNGNL